MAAALVLAAPLLALTACGEDDGPADSARRAPRPHVLILLADDLGWNDVGFHGSRLSTPHIDRLAEQGIRLERHYALHRCTPSRSALLTGRYPIRQGLQSGVIWPWADWGLPLEERTLADALDEVGYHTAILGKWHLGFHSEAQLPTRRGFDHHYGCYLGLIDQFTHRRAGGLDWHRNGEPVIEEGYTTDLLAREAVRLVEAHDAAEPLFLYVSFTAPHVPLQAPERCLPPDDGRLETGARRRYAGLVTCLDEAVGRIVEAFQRRGLWDRTFVLLTSDNGGDPRSGGDNTPLRAGKKTLYEGGIRVPSVVVWPDRLEPGGRVDEVVHLVDWFPTIARLAGAEVEGPLPLDGVDLGPTLREGRPPPRETLLLNVERDAGGVMRGPWKLLVRWDEGAPEHELYHVVRDPREEHELAGEHPELVEALAKRLSAFAEKAEPAKARGRNRPPKGFRPPEVWGPAR